MISFIIFVYFWFLKYRDWWRFICEAGFKYSFLHGSDIAPFKLSNTSIKFDKYTGYPALDSKYSKNYYIEECLYVKSTISIQFCCYGYFPFPLLFSFGRIDRCNTFKWSDCLVLFKTRLWIHSRSKYLDARLTSYCHFSKNYPPYQDVCTFCEKFIFIENWA